MAKLSRKIIAAKFELFETVWKNMEWWIKNFAKKNSGVVIVYFDLQMGALFERLFLGVLDVLINRVFFIFNTREPLYL